LSRKTARTDRKSTVAPLLYNSSDTEHDQGKRGGGRRGDRYPSKKGAPEERRVLRSLKTPKKHTVSISSIAARQEEQRARHVPWKVRKQDTRSQMERVPTSTQGRFGKGVGKSRKICMIQTLLEKIRKGGSFVGKESRSLPLSPQRLEMKRKKKGKEEKRGKDFVQGG